VAHYYGSAGVATGTPRDLLTPDEDKASRDATMLCLGAVLSGTGDKLIDAYLYIRDGKDLWDALEAKFGTTDVGGQFKMTTRWLKTNL
jgi:hypothetical protein